MYEIELHSSDTSPVDIIYFCSQSIFWERHRVYGGGVCRILMSRAKLPNEWKGKSYFVTLAEWD